ncbi:MAG TPA: hypothetical protein VKQ54_02140 [Caulobacteraceae bacterium]|nr:hypothetical protein [Caulobacteraceae bacterium]
MPSAELGPPAFPRLIDAGWAVMPIGQLAGYWPDRALRMELSGKATAACSLTAEGVLVGCWIASVEPKDQGFELATLKMTTALKTKRFTRTGESVEGGTYMLVSHFDVSGCRFTLRLTTPGATNGPSTTIVRGCEP